MTRALSIALVALSLTGCGGTIGLRGDFAAQNFQVGQTTRSDVVARLGQPQQILKDEHGREHWFYEARSRDNAAACTWCGGMLDGTRIMSMKRQSTVKNGAEYVFDADQVLVGKSEPRHDKN